MGINWNPLTTDYKFTDDNELRLLVGTNGSGSTTLEAVNNSTHFNQILSALGYLGVGVSAIDSNTRITQTLITQCRNNVNTKRGVVAQTAYTFVEPLAERNLHNILVELRKAISETRVSASANIYVLRQIVEDPYNGGVISSAIFSSFGCAAGKRYQDLAVGAYRYRTMVTFGGPTFPLGANPKLIINVTIESQVLETYNLLIGLPLVNSYSLLSDFNFMSQLGSASGDDLALANANNTPLTVDLNPGFYGDEIYLLFATDNEFNDLGLDPYLAIGPSGVLSGATSLAPGCTFTIITDQP